MTETQVREALRTVIDPELNVSILDLGLIYRVSVSPSQSDTGSSWKIHIVMTLTSPGCPLAGSFQFLVWDALRGFTDINPEEDVFIELTFDPPWSQDMMTDELKAQFGVGSW